MIPLSEIVQRKDYIVGILQKCGFVNVKIYNAGDVYLRFVVEQDQTNPAATVLNRMPVAAYLAKQLGCHVIVHPATTIDPLNLKDVLQNCVDINDEAGIKRLFMCGEHLENVVFQSMQLPNANEQDAFDLTIESGVAIAEELISSFDLRTSSSPQFFSPPSPLSSSQAISPIKEIKGGGSTALASSPKKSESTESSVLDRFRQLITGAANAYELLQLAIQYPQSAQKILEEHAAALTSSSSASSTEKKTEARV